MAFGRLFSGIKIVRLDNLGAVHQTLEVPIAYSQKDKWFHAVQGNPDGEKGIYTALPRMGFEITGYSYDAQRKLGRMNKIYCAQGDTRTQIGTPVPYTVNISLYFATKSQEDGLQILEQILPTFSPDYTLTVSSVPELNVVQDVPFTLDSVSVQDDFEGDMEMRRFVIHTLTFTAKINLFGGIGSVGLIKQVEANMSQPDVAYIGRQETMGGPITETFLGDF